MSGDAPVLSPVRAPWQSRSMDAYLLAVDSVAELLARPEVVAAWESPSALAEWSVGGLAGHLAAQVFAGVNLIEAEPSRLAPIALDEHYRRVSWIGAAVEDDVSVDIRAGGDEYADAGPQALVAAARESSIVVGALFGWLVLKEARPLHRLVGSAVVAVGIAAIVLG
jgi:hypothetical protein